jgi:LmbE family N-acetylglucosaminyl deacetylase
LAARRQEAIRAGKILGIRRQYFLDQKDLGFDSDAAAAESGNWDRERLRAFLSDLLTTGHYDAVFTLLPTPQTHGHHRAATILTLQTVAQIPEAQRPLVLGAEPRSKVEAAFAFGGLPAQPLTRTVDSSPVFVFDRTTAFGYRNALSYQIVVNWVSPNTSHKACFRRTTASTTLSSFGFSRSVARTPPTELNSCRPN